MFNQQSPAPLDPTNVSLALNKLAWQLTQTGATSVEVFLHTRFGSRYLGLYAWTPLMAIPFVGSLSRPEDFGPAFVFTLMYLFLLLCHYLDIWLRCRRGDREHSRYNGRPSWIGSLGSTHERGMKLYVEPVLVMGIGLLVLGYNGPLGGYLIFAGLCLAITNNTIDRWDRQQAMDMHDAVIDQQQRAERFRGQSGRR